LAAVVALKVMDDISSKLKKLFKPRAKAFKGKGNVLGNAGEVIPDACLVQILSTYSYQSICCLSAEFCSKISTTCTYHWTDTPSTELPRASNTTNPPRASAGVRPSCCTA
jgi:hypothetical protein